MSGTAIADVEVLILDPGVEYGQPSGSAGELSGPRHLCRLPADRPDELAALGRGTPLRIATGEQLGGVSELAELLRDEGVSVVQPDLSRCGGFTALQRIAALAKARGALVVPPSWASHLLTAASLQAVCWLEDEPLIEVSASAAPLVSELAPLDLGLTDGRVRVPDGPGLGVVVDPAVIDRHRVA
jgi:L-alanine-DL-glutamate epimerase-like enolase superfamily enzyme